MEVVETKELAKLIREFLGEPYCLAMRRPDFGQAGILNSIEVIVARSCFSHRVIYKIMKGETKYTTLRVADIVVCAIHRPEVFHTGELNVFDIDIKCQKGGTWTKKSKRHSTRSRSSRKPTSTISSTG